MPARVLYGGIEGAAALRGLLFEVVGYILVIACVVWICRYLKRAAGGEKGRTDCFTSSGCYVPSHKERTLKPGRGGRAHRN